MQQRKLIMVITNVIFQKAIILSRRLINCLKNNRIENLKLKMEAQVRLRKA